MFSFLGFVSSLFLLPFFSTKPDCVSDTYVILTDSQEEDYEALKDFKEIAAVYYPDFDT